LTNAEAVEQAIGQTVAAALGMKSVRISRRWPD